LYQNNLFGITKKEQTEIKSEQRVVDETPTSKRKKQKEDDVKNLKKKYIADYLALQVHYA